MFERINDLKINLEKTTSIKDIPEEHGREIEKIAFECLEDCKSTVKREGMESVLLSIDKEIKIEWLQTYLKKILNRMMFSYNSLEPLRCMEGENILLLISFINDIFDNCVIRNNAAFLGEYEEYGLKSEEQMSNISLAFRSLTRFYIIQRYSRNSIVEDFVEETGLSESVAKLVAETIERSYNQLQMAVLMEHLANRRV